MSCNKKFTLPLGQKMVFIGCPKEHGDKTKDVEFECGETFTWGTCKSNHTYKCTECTEIMPSGSGVQRTPMKKCSNLIPFEIGDTIRFSECSHKATKKRTWICGQSSETNEDCTNTDHTIKCTKCFECSNVIVVENVSEAIFSPNCQIKHSFGPATYKCGKNLYFSDCQHNHFIKCQDCGGQFTPTTTSTPKINSSEQKMSEAEEFIRNKTLDDLTETRKKVKKALIDDDQSDDIMNKDDCINRKHEFEMRTKRILSAPGRKFLQAYDTFMMQFDPNVFGDEIPKDLGDNLLKEVYDTYDIMEEARLKCLEVLTENDRMNNPKYDQYLRDRLAKKCECQRVHNEYFKINQNYQTLKPQTLSFDTPLKPQNAMPQFNHPKVPQPGGNLHKIIDQNMSHSQTFIPPIQRNPITSYSSERFPYFKMNEEILLVEKFNASKPRSYMAFRAQWQNFEAKMTKANRSELDKFYALLRVVDGQAKNLIHSEYPNNDSYREAINLLDKLFYEPSNLLRDMIKKLNRVNKMTDSYDSLLQGTISLRKAWLDLNQANLNIEQLKGLLFIATTEKQLSEGSWKIWLDVQNDARNDQDPNFSFDINHYMHAINLAMSNCCKRENAIGKSLQTENKFKPKSTLYGSYFTKPLNKEPTFKEGNTYKQANVNGKCVFCGYPVHKFQLYCPKLKKALKPNQIVEIMGKHDIKCYLCLGLNHRTKFCEAFKDGRLKRCSVIENKEKCNKLHCRFLHRYKNQPNSNLTTTPNELNNTESQNDSVQSQE